jgi:hypothetical protein
VEGTPQGDEGARRRLALTAAAALAALAAIVALALLAGGGSDEPVEFPEGTAPPPGDNLRIDATAEAAGCSARNPKSEGETETGDPVDYRSDPPHSGDHAPEPAQDTAYRSDPPADEALVHTLYHGRVVVWFNPDLEERSLGALKALYDESPEHVLLVPNESMDAEVAATAWTQLLTCPRLEDATFDAIRAFRDRWRDQGPEFVP